MLARLRAPTVVWSPLALERVEANAAEIAGERAATALRWVRALFKGVHQLRQYPRSGRIAPDLARPEIRQNCSIRRIGSSIGLSARTC